MPRPSGLTPAQRSAFFRALQAASIELGHTTTEEREAYRKTVMREETGKAHLAQLSRTADFDACMRRFCADAGDDANAIKYAVGATTRLRSLILEAAAQIAPHAPLAYVAGVMLQSRTVTGINLVLLVARLSQESFWCQLSVSQLRRVLAMLKTHQRRNR